MGCHWRATNNKPAIKEPATQAANIPATRELQLNHGGWVLVAIHTMGMKKNARPPMQLEYSNEKRKSSSRRAHVIPGFTVKSRMGGTSPKAESQSTAFRIVLPHVEAFMPRPVVSILLALSHGARMTGQAGSFLGRQGFGLKPGGGRSGVGRARQILLDPLEPLLRFILLAQPGVRVGHAD